MVVLMEGAEGVRTPAELEEMVPNLAYASLARRGWGRATVVAGVNPVR